MSDGFERPEISDDADPRAGVAMIIAGVLQACVGIFHAGLTSIGLLVVLIDPSTRSDPAVLAGVFGVMGVCFLAPDLISFGLGGLSVLMGNRIRTQAFSPTSLTVAGGLVAWSLTRTMLDLMLCQCSMLMFETLPLVAAIVALVFAINRE